MENTDFSEVFGDDNDENFPYDKKQQKRLQALNMSNTDNQQVPRFTKIEETLATINKIKQTVSDLNESFTKESPRSSSKLSSSYAVKSLPSTSTNTTLSNLKRQDQENKKPSNSAGNGNDSISLDELTELQEEDKDEDEEADAFEESFMSKSEIHNIYDPALSVSMSMDARNGSLSTAPIQITPSLTEATNVTTSPAPTASDVKTMSNSNIGVLTTSDIVLLNHVYDQILQQLLETKENYNKSIDIITQTQEENLELESLVEELEAELTKMQGHVIQARSDEEFNKYRRTSINSSQIHSSLILANKTAQVGNRIKKRIEARKSLIKSMNQAVNHDEHEIDDNVSQFIKQINENEEDSNLKSSYKNWINKRLPFRSEILHIEGLFGASVASYFVFLRFIFLQFCLLCAVAIVFSYFHITNMVSHMYWHTVFDSNGALPGFMHFSSYTTNEGATYTFMIIIIFIVFLFGSVRKLVSEDRRSKQLDMIEQQVKVPFCHSVFCSWDFAVNDDDKAAVYSGRIAQQVALVFAESKSSGAKLSRSQYHTTMLYLRRFWLFILYTFVQAGASASLFLVTAYSNDIQRQTVKAFHLSSTSTSVSYLPLIIYNVINAAMPWFLYYLTIFERWDSGEYEINFLLVRMFLNNLIGAMIITLSYYLLANPYVLALYPQFRRYFALPLSDTFVCRIDQTASNLFTLVLVSFAFQVFTDLTTPLGYYVYSICTGTKYIRAEYDVASSMVSLFSFITLIFLCYPFAPLTLLFAPCYFFIRFYVQYFVAINYNSKPNKPWKAQKVSNTFTLLYLITFMIICVPTTIFFLLSTTFPKSCQIQDNTVGLCKTAVSYKTNNCTTNPSSDFYPMYGNSNYPAFICESACGPFINNQANIDPFRSVVLFTPATEAAVTGIVVYPYLPWGLVLIFFIYAATLRNTIKIREKASKERERDHESHIHDLIVRKNNIEKRLSVLQSIDSIQNDAHDRNSRVNGYDEQYEEEEDEDEDEDDNRQERKFEPNNVQMKKNK